jgi:hypothetical protein
MEKYEEIRPIMKAIGRNLTYHGAIGRDSTYIYPEAIGRNSTIMIAIGRNSTHFDTFDLWSQRKKSDLSWKTAVCFMVSSVVS